MTATDLAIAIPILAATLALLYRSFRRRGACAGCGGCNAASRCGPEVVTLERPR